MTRKMTFWLASASVLMLAVPAGAAIIAEESFTDSGMTNWGSAAEYTSEGLSFPSLASAGGAANIAVGPQSGQVVDESAFNNTDFAAASGVEPVYASALLKVAGSEDISAGGGVVSARFHMTSTSSNDRTVSLGIADDGDGNPYLYAEGNAGKVNLGAYNYGETALLVADFNNIVYGNWQNPEVEAAVLADVGDTPAWQTVTFGGNTTDLTGIDAVSLYAQAYDYGGWNDQKFASGTGDEIRLGESYEDVLPIPEPATLSLMALSGLALVIRRRTN